MKIYRYEIADETQENGQFYFSRQKAISNLETRLQEAKEYSHYYGLYGDLMCEYEKITEGNYDFDDDFVCALMEKWFAEKIQMLGQCYICHIVEYEVKED